MTWDTTTAIHVENKLNNLLEPCKKVHSIETCHRKELESYGVVFKYRNKHYNKDYLLMFDPEFENLTACADGAVTPFPEHVRQHIIRTFDRYDPHFNKINYSMSGILNNIHTWQGVSLDTLVSITD